MLKNCMYRRNITFTLDDVKLVLDTELCPKLYKLFFLSLMNPINFATFERPFSAMRKNKSWLGISMNQDRFIDLSIIYIQQNLSNELSNTKSWLNLQLRIGGDSCNS